jgi:hypothetical protein
MGLNDSMYSKPVLGGQEMDFVNRSPRNDNIIAVFKRDLPVHGFHPTMAFMHKNHLIGISVFEKVVLGAFVRGCQSDVQVVVDKQGFTAFQIVVRIGHFKALETQGR